MPSLARCHLQQFVLAAGCGDNAIKLFEPSQTPSGEHQDQQSSAFQLACSKQNAHTADVNCVRWSPTEPSLLASAGDDNTIRLWQYTPDPDNSIIP